LTSFCALLRLTSLDETGYKALQSQVRRRLGGSFYERGKGLVLYDVLPGDFGTIKEPIMQHENSEGVGFVEKRHRARAGKGS